jgi:hypothetical protein
VRAVIVEKRSGLGVSSVGLDPVLPKVGFQ